MMKRLAGIILVAGVSVAPYPAWAVTATIAGSPSVTVEVPKGFTASDTDRGVEIKTPDDEVMVWFETYKPSEQSTLIEEHDKYWNDQNVRLGQATRKSEEADGHKIVVTSYDAATWKGKPTVIRYLFIDGGFPSKEMILMSVWASPEGMNEHNADVSKIVDSIEIK